MPTVYARLEPTTDSTTASLIRANSRWANAKQQRDVVLYSDRGVLQFYCRIP